MLLLANAGCKQLEILKFWAKETSDDMAKETSDDNCVRPPLTIVTAKELGEDKVIADSKFAITYNDKFGLENVTMSDAKADIRDLQAFTITIYRQRLQKKLTEGESLSRGEIDILKFICLVQHVTFGSITAYGYKALTAPEITDVSVSKDFSQERDEPNSEYVTSPMINILNLAIENFAKNNNVLSRLISVWSQDATIPEAENIFREIIAPQYGKKTYDSKFLNPSPDDFFAFKVTGISVIGGATTGVIGGPVGAAVGAVGGGIAGAATGAYLGWKKDGAGVPSKKDGTYTGNEYSNSRLFNQYKDMKILNNKQKALLWGQVADSLRFYSQDLGDLHKDMGICIKKTKNSYVKREVEDLRIQYSIWCEEDFYKFREVYYAYTFICACNKLYNNIQAARRLFWKNDKNQITDATMLFCETTSIKNNEMIKNLNSRYAAKVYSDTIIELKKRAGDKVYREIQDKCRLWSLDDPEFELGDEVFGLRKVKYQAKEK